MTAPLYNSRATKIAFVIDGEGCFEMACPHLSSGSSSEQYGHGQGSRSSMQKQKKSKRYQRVSGRLTRGVVFIVPAGHPYSLVASPSNNLEVVCFEVDSEGNIKYPLAGIVPSNKFCLRSLRLLGFDFCSESEFLYFVFQGMKTL